MLFVPSWHYKLVRSTALYISSATCSLSLLLQIILDRGAAQKLVSTGSACCLICLTWKQDQHAKRNLWCRRWCCKRCLTSHGTCREQIEEAVRTRFAAEEADLRRVAGEALLPHTLCQFNKYMLLPSNLYCQQCSTAVPCSNVLTLRHAVQLHHSSLWAAWYITRLLVELTPKGAVFSFLTSKLAFGVDFTTLLPTLPSLA